MTLTYEIGYSIKSAKAELELLECFKEFNSLMRRIGDAVEKYENTVDHKFNYKNINEFKPFMDFYPFAVSLNEVNDNWGDVKIDEGSEKKEEKS
jgi:hypothetical protein